MDLGEAIRVSRSLQAFHLSFNGIPDAAKNVLFDTIRVNKKQRSNKSEIQAEQLENTIAEVVEKDKQPAKMIIKADLTE